MELPAVRLLHIVSSALMFGVGVGAFWFVNTTVRSGDIAAVRILTRNAVRAEYLIGVPVALVQPVTGYLLMLGLDYSFRSSWFWAVAVSYIVTGMAWVYLVKAEISLRDVAAAPGPALPPEFAPVLRRSRILATLTLAGVLVLFGLMVFRPGL